MRNYFHNIYANNSFVANEKCSSSRPQFAALNNMLLKEADATGLQKIDFNNIGLLRVPKFI